MKKNQNVVCKNCGTEYILGKKRKLTNKHIVGYVLSLGILIWMVVLLCYYFEHRSPEFVEILLDEAPLFLWAIEIGCLVSFFAILSSRFGCPECGRRDCVPADTPVGKKLKRGAYQK